MATCDVCGAQESMPYNCRHCGGTHCAEHRLPENHGCSGLHNWNDPQGVFDSGFDERVNPGSETSTRAKIASKIPFGTGPGGALGYFRGNVAYAFLALMWVTFALQYITLFVGGQPLHDTLFMLSSAHPEYVWTWFTSIFAHGGLYHIVGNSLVVFFFGPLVERYVGSRKFAILFLASGVLAGLGQIFISVAQGDPAAVLGASGAGLAILGVLTILNPDLRVYLYFILPVPIWLITAGYAVFSVFFLVSDGAGFNIAHGAHLIGLLIGLAYGQYVKNNRNIRAPNQLQLGGGPGGGRRRF